MDIPTKTPETTGGSLGQETLRPAEGHGQGVHRGRQVTAGPANAHSPFRGGNKDVKAGAAAVGAHYGRDSGQAIAGPSSSTGGAAGRSPRSTEPASEFVAACKGLQSLRDNSRHRSDPEINARIKDAQDAARTRIMSIFYKFIGNREKLNEQTIRATVAERAYFKLSDLARQAEQNGDFLKSGTIRIALQECGERTNEKVQELYAKYGEGVIPSTGAERQGRAAAPKTTAAASTLPSASKNRQFDWLAEHGQFQKLYLHVRKCGPLEMRKAFKGADDRIGNCIRYRARVLGLPIERPHQFFPDEKAAELRYRAIVDKARRAAESNNDELAGKFDRALYEVHRTTRRVLAELAAKYGPLETLAKRVERSEQQEPVTIAPPVAVRRASDQIVQPPAIRAGSSGGASAIWLPAPSRGDDDFAVERALLAGNLPPGFDASLLVAEASIGDEFWLVDELEARRLPTKSIDALLQYYETTDEGGSYTPDIEYLRSVKENVERALRAAYPGRTESEWLARVQAQLLTRVELADDST